MVWGIGDVGSQEGRTVLCTGANSGLGFYFTKFMVLKGATVIAACRSIDKGQKAKDDILRELADEKACGTIDVMQLDLADLASVREFVGKVKDKYEKLDVLCNNAGVMALNPRETTKDGFEMQFGSNHLGHFALTMLLLPLLLKGTDPRIVNVSSIYHKQCHAINFEDLQMEKAYDPWRAYAQSKLANILFTRELNRRFSEAKLPIIAVAAHPGYSPTNLQAKMPWIVKGLLSLMKPISHPPSEGVLSQLRAAVDPEAKPNDYYGPKREMFGAPIKAEVSSAAKDDDAARKLWDVSEDLTKERFEFFSK